VWVSDLVGLLAGGGAVTVTGWVWLVVWWARGNRADDEAIEQKLRDQIDHIETDHRRERTRLQSVIDAERAGRREAEDEAARLRRLVRELGGDPG
jgi:hypothetical protein